MQWMNKKGVLRLLQPIIYIALAVVGILVVSRLLIVKDETDIQQVTATGSHSIEILSNPMSTTGPRLVSKKGNGYIDVDQAPYGYVYAAYNSQRRAKFSLVKDENAVHHDLMNDGIAQRFSLTAGSGKYQATIYENVTDISYKKVKSLKFIADIYDHRVPYLVSNNVVRYDDTLPVIQKAAELATSELSQMEKAKALYNWVVETIAYDYELLGKLESGYVSDVSQTYKTGKGICYDFAVLYASMCRSQGIPCKVVSGYAEAVEGYHAWNEVYFDDTYHVVDTSTDAQLEEYPFTRDGGYEAIRYD